MYTIQREDAKKDPVYSKVFEIIRKGHQVAGHTQEVLMKNKSIKDFCEEARHFGILGGKEPLHVHYDVCTWIHNESFLVRIDAVAFYDNFLEYEVARLKALHSGDHKSSVSKN